jgi:hypothetical protein
VTGRLLTADERAAIAARDALSYIQGVDVFADRRALLAHADAADARIAELEATLLDDDAIRRYKRLHL